MHKFLRKFSLPHREFSLSKHASITDAAAAATYNAVKNSSQQFRDEISDIYFGHSYRYYYNGNLTRFGEVMGVEASDSQILHLFKIQDEFNIPISLTLNTLETHMEIMHDKTIREGLISYIKNFYDHGLRICTISSRHLMTSGILQEHFPDMEWKNTVNHMVRTAQEVADYAALGYTTIQLDRSLNRNFDEIKKCKIVADRKGVKTSLLVSEGCLPSCPFKDEHDMVQYQAQNTVNYWLMYGDLSCNRWRLSGEPMPRTGTDLNAVTAEQLDLLLENVDILKFSGRLGAPVQNDSMLDCYHWRIKPSAMAGGKPEEIPVKMDSFQSIYDKGFEPYNLWIASATIEKNFADKINAVDTASFKNNIKNSMFYRWNTPKGRALSKVLTNCQNQCYDCHACEKVFGQPNMDTLLELKKPNTNKYYEEVEKNGQELEKRVIMLKNSI
jgi:hypothetical protein